MIYLYGKGKRYQITKDLLKQNNVKDKLRAIDKNSKNLKNVFNEKFFLKKYNIKKDYLIITIADPYKRFKIFNRLRKKIKIKFYKPLVSKLATIKKNVKIGRGTIVMDHAYIGENVQISQNCSIGVSTLVSHDTTIKSFSEISHKSKIAGNVKIGQKCFLGMGCLVVQKVSLMNACFIGAGVLVKKNLKSNTKLTLKQNLKKNNT